MMGDYPKQLKRQTATRKINSFEMVGKGNPFFPVDVILPESIVPPTNRKHCLLNEEEREKKEMWKHERETNSYIQSCMHLQRVMRIYNIYT